MKLPLLFLFLLPFAAKAQSIDNTPPSAAGGYSHYFRFSYENDFFQATDRYYTQGIQAELVSPSLQHIPVMRLLIHPHSGSATYGVAVQHAGYTPTSISSDDILHGDRPFA